MSALEQIKGLGFKVACSPKYRGRIRYMEVTASHPKTGKRISAQSPSMLSAADKVLKQARKYIQSQKEGEK